MLIKEKSLITSTEKLLISRPLQLAVQLRSTTVVPNRGAAAHKGAVKRCQGCRQILNLQTFLVHLPLRVPRIVILAR